MIIFLFEITLTTPIFRGYKSFYKSMGNFSDAGSEMYTIYYYVTRNQTSVKNIQNSKMSL